MKYSNQRKLLEWQSPARHLSAHWRSKPLVRVQRPRNAIRKWHAKVISYLFSHLRTTTETLMIQTFSRKSSTIQHPPHREMTNIISTAEKADAVSVNKIHRLQVNQYTPYTTFLLPGGSSSRHVLSSTPAPPDSVGLRPAD